MTGWNLPKLPGGFPRFSTLQSPPCNRLDPVEGPALLTALLWKTIVYPVLSKFPPQAYRLLNCCFKLDFPAHPCKSTDAAACHIKRLEGQNTHHTQITAACFSWCICPKQAIHFTCEAYNLSKEQDINLHTSPEALHPFIIHTPGESSAWSMAFPFHLTLKQWAEREVWSEHIY